MQMEAWTFTLDQNPRKGLSLIRFQRRESFRTQFCDSMALKTH
jgi:hypothetical protein